MRQFLFIIVLLSVPASAQSFDRPGNHWFAIRHDGILRSFLLHVPRSYELGKKWPLVISLHGGGGSPAGQMATEHLAELSEQDGFLVVYPRGTHGAWNAGLCCGIPAEQGTGDIGFLGAMLEEIERFYRIDTDRIFATGISNGAMMVNRMACEMAGELAAVAPVAGSLVIPDCRPARFVAWLAFHGEQDECVPIAKGALGNCAAQLARQAFGITIAGTAGVTVPSLDSVLALWRHLDRTTGEGREAYARGGATCEVFSGGDVGTAVGACRLADGGHTWPGGGYGSACDRPSSRICRLLVQITGPISPSIDASEAMWTFFRRHPRS